MHQLIRLALCSSLTAVLATSVASASAQPAKDHDHDHDTLEQHTHAHGSVTFNIALEGELLVVELDAPADNVVGFEKSPRNEAERKAVADANAWFASGRNFAAVPGNAGCRLQSVDFVPPKFGSGHADYRGRFTYRCSNPGAIAWVDLWALRSLRELEKIEVNVITPTLQRQTELAAGISRVSLK